MRGEKWVAFLGGMVVGGVVALLLAPESGAQTRERINKFVDKEVDEARRMGRKMKNDIDRMKGNCTCTEGGECICDDECDCGEDCTCQPETKA